MNIHPLSAGMPLSGIEQRFPQRAARGGGDGCLDIRLQPRQHLRLAPGAALRVMAGTAWITDDGGHADIVLDAGQTYTCGRDGKALLAAIGNVRLCLDGMLDAVPAQRRSAWAALRALFA